MPTSSHFLQGQWQIGTFFLPPPEPSSLLIPSRKPSTNFQTLLLTGAEPATPAVTGDNPSLDIHWRRTEERTRSWDVSGSVFAVSKLQQVWNYGYSGHLSLLTPGDWKWAVVYQCRLQCASLVRLTRVVVCRHVAPRMQLQWITAGSAAATSCWSRVMTDGHCAVIGRCGKLSVDEASYSI